MGSLAVSVIELILAAVRGDGKVAETQLGGDVHCGNHMVVRGLAVGSQDQGYVARCRPRLFNGGPDGPASLSTRRWSFRNIRPLVIDHQLEASGVSARSSTTLASGRSTFSSAWRSNVVLTMKKISSRKHDIDQRRQINSRLFLDAVLQFQASTSGNAGPELCHIAALYGFDQRNGLFFHGDDVGFNLAFEIPVKEKAGNGDGKPGGGGNQGF